MFSPHNYHTGLLQALPAEKLDENDVAAVDLLVETIEAQSRDTVLSRYHLMCTKDAFDPKNIDLADRICLIDVCVLFSLLFLTQLLSDD